MKEDKEKIIEIKKLIKRWGDPRDHSFDNWELIDSVITVVHDL